MCTISTLLVWSQFCWLAKCLLKRYKLTIHEIHNKNCHFFTLKYVFFWLCKVFVYTLFKKCPNIIKITWTVFFRCFWRCIFSRTSKMVLPNLGTSVTAAKNQQRPYWKNIVCSDSMSSNIKKKPMPNLQNGPKPISTLKLEVYTWYKD